MNGFRPGWTRPEQDVSWARGTNIMAGALEPQARVQSDVQGSRERNMCLPGLRMGTRGCRQVLSLTFLLLSVPRGHSC